MDSDAFKQMPWQAKGDDKRLAVQGMFAEIAPTYDAMNSIMSMRRHGRWRRSAVAKLQLEPGQTVLDLCCGTGDFASILRQFVGSSGKVIGLDFCRPMLDIAAVKNVPFDTLVEGDACRIPIASNTFDAVAVGWGIRNVVNADTCHKEIVRILKKGGRFVSIDMAVPRSKLIRSGSRVLFHRVVPFIGGLFGKRRAYEYLPKSTERFYSREELATSMQSAGFENVEYEDLFFGQLCMHWGVKA